MFVVCSIFVMLVKSDYNSESSLTQYSGYNLKETCRSFHIIREPTKVGGGMHDDFIIYYLFHDGNAEIRVVLQEGSRLNPLKDIDQKEYQGELSKIFRADWVKIIGEVWITMKYTKTNRTKFACEFYSKYLGKVARKIFEDRTHGKDAEYAFFGAGSILRIRDKMGDILELRISRKKARKFGSSNIKLDSFLQCDLKALRVQPGFPDSQINVIPISTGEW